jgi:hypothetical protein
VVVPVSLPLVFLAGRSTVSACEALLFEAFLGVFADAGVFDATGVVDDTGFFGDFVVFGVFGVTASLSHFPVFKTDTTYVSQ